MRRIYVDVLLWVLSVPTLLVRRMVITYRYFRFLRAATAPSIRCSCGETLWLVGLWQCRCGFTYRGHLLRLCPVCWTIPCVVRCYSCGLTAKLPEAMS